MQMSSMPEFVLGSKDVADAMEVQRPLPIFSGEACGFLQAVSEHLMNSSEARLHTDVMAFAFWCRKASLYQMARQYSGERFRFGRGIVFHIAPSNVALNFAYSMAAALLAGNASIVRLPSTSFPQVEILCDAVKHVLWGMEAARNFICLVRYGHEKGINDAFSSICDVRVVWGGDRTIRELRRSPLKVRASEIVFADRYSIAVIDADAYLELKNKERVARDFYHDTYLTDQNACTSPRLVIWLGEERNAARETFWKTLRDVIEKEHYELRPVQAVDKLTRLCLLGARKPSRRQEEQDNVIVRAMLETLDSDVMSCMGNSGFFLEYDAKNLEELLPVCGERCQTISYCGDIRESLLEWVMRSRPRGVDRVVPMGRTMDFSLVWDGHDLIREMSREVPGN